MRCCFSSPHTYTHRRGEQETGCVFFAHNRHTPCSHLHAERTWQLAARRVNYSHDSKHSMRHYTSIVEIAHPFSFRLHTSAYASKTPPGQCEFLHTPESRIGEMCLLKLNLTAFCARQPKKGGIIFSRNHLHFAPSCQLTERYIENTAGWERRAFCPGS